MHLFIKLCFLVSLCLEFRQVMSNIKCECDDVKKCYDIDKDILSLYGKDETYLNKTCDLLSTSIDCVTNFTSRCAGDSDGDNDCKQAIESAKKSGFQTEYDELCNMGDEYKESYLEHYDCFKTAVNEYDGCHNLAAVSHQFINNKYTLKKKCCLFSWYKGCLIDATNGTCKNEAALVTGSLLDMVLYYILKDCQEVKACLKPPLPDGSKGTIVEQTDTEESTTIEPTIKKVTEDPSGAAGILVASNVYNIMGHFLILRLMFNFVLYY